MGDYRVHNVRFYRSQPETILCMAYERSTKQLALARSDHSIQIWDLAYTAHQTKTIPPQPEINISGMIWVGTRLFCASLTECIAEYDLRLLKKKQSMPVTGGGAWCLAANNKRTHLAVGTDAGYVCLFEIVDDGLQYDKILYKQDTQITSMAWHPDGEFIVTGSNDRIRVYNIHSGQSQTIIPGRDAAKNPTIVWSLLFQSDFTIVSGDSRGKVCFWNGTNATLKEVVDSHKAHVTCLCMSEDEQTICAAGADPTIYFIERLKDLENDTDILCRRQWVKSLRRILHTHTVRGLAVDGNKLISGGDDTYLVLSIYPPKKHMKYPPLPQIPYIYVAASSRQVLFRKSNSLELWKLGSTDVEHGENSAELPLCESNQKLLQMSSKDYIICAAISGDSSWISYSSENKLCLFRFTLENGSPKLQKVCLRTSKASPANCLMFTANNKLLLVGTIQGTLQILQLDKPEPVLLHTFPNVEGKDSAEAIHLLDISGDCKFAVTADYNHNITVWDLTKRKIHCGLPKYNCPPTALKVHPTTNNVVVVYADHKILEFNIKNKKFTDFSKSLMDRHPEQWLNRSNVVTQISFDPRNKNIIILHDDNTICVIDKDKDLPEVRAKLQRVDPLMSDDTSGSTHSMSQSWRDGPVHGFYICKKYEHLAYFGSLQGDEMVAVEINPAKITDSLPEGFARKVFGV